MIAGLRILMLAGAGALIGYIVWALDEPFWESVNKITALKWGQVTLVDLYLGFAISMLVIVLTERRLLVGLLWAVPVLFLGNFWTAFWFAWRMPELVVRLRDRF